MKKGYFFIIDSIIALLVMSLGVILVFSFHKFSSASQQTPIFSSDIIMLLNTKVKNLNNDYCGINSIITRDGNITEIDNSYLEQLAEFYYRNRTKSCGHCMQLARNVVRNLSIGVSEDVNFYVAIDNTIMYERNISPIGSAVEIVPTRKVVHALYNSTESAGPYIAEVFLWR